MRPCPVQIPTIGLERVELVDEHRCLSCPHYSDCLDLAVARKWPGFSCRECPLAVGLAPLTVMPEPRKVAPPPRPSPSRPYHYERVGDLLARSAVPLRVVEIAAALGFDMMTTNNAIRRAVERGLARRVKFGVYEAVRREGAA